MPYYILTRTSGLQLWGRKPFTKLSHALWVLKIVVLWMFCQRTYSFAKFTLCKLSGVVRDRKAICSAYLPQAVKNLCNYLSVSSIRFFLLSKTRSRSGTCTWQKPRSEFLKKKAIQSASLSYSTAWALIVPLACNNLYGQFQCEQRRFSLWLSPSSIRGCLF
jgi:hypothetical protein